MRRWYGDRDAGERLRRARVANGFASARRAAEAFQWSPSTYAAHESGSRYVSEEQWRAYAEAYDVPPEWLERGFFPKDTGAHLRPDELVLRERLEVITRADIADRKRHVDRRRY